MPGKKKLAIERHNMHIVTIRTTPGTPSAPTYKHARSHRPFDLHHTCIPIAFPAFRAFQLTPHHEIMERAKLCRSPVAYIFIVTTKTAGS
jgi:hypothetical protein